MRADSLPTVTHHEVVAGRRFTRIEMFTGEDEPYALHYIGARVVPISDWEGARRAPPSN